MAQHHRLSPLARAITLVTVASMTDDQIHEFFARLRWGADGRQACPRCGTLDRHYPRKPRRRTSRRPASGWHSNGIPSFQCKGCFHVFTVTSGSLFDRTRLSLRQILGGLVLFLAPGNGNSALQLCTALGLSYKTAFLLEHRFREVMAADQPEAPFDGIVQMDGGYFCGKPHKPNQRGPRVTREQLQRRFGKAPIGETEKPWVAAGMTRKNWEKMRKNKRTVLVATHSNGAPGAGSRAVRVVVVKAGERETPILEFAKAAVAPGTMVMTDEAGAYNVLARGYDHYSVSHGKEFSSEDGVNDNHAEAFFSRMRRAEYGIYHGYIPLNLHFYACENAWRHTHRRTDKLEQVERILTRALHMGISTRLRGYYDKRAVRSEVLMPG